MRDGNPVGIDHGGVGGGGNSPGERVGTAVYRGGNPFEAARVGDFVPVARGGICLSGQAPVDPWQGGWF